MYGEELEAYIAAGIVTHAGFAFSRDQTKKIYIQHKMLEDGEMLAEVLGGQGHEGASRRGVFYLCGPTWPVPDVYEALIGALNQYAGFEREAAAQHIEDLKEEERYVLEVRPPHRSLDRSSNGHVFTGVLKFSYIRTPLFMDIQGMHRCSIHECQKDYLEMNHVFSTSLVSTDDLCVQAKTSKSGRSNDRNRKSIKRARV